MAVSHILKSCAWVRVLDISGTETSELTTSRVLAWELLPRIFRIAVQISTGPLWLDIDQRGRVIKPDNLLIQVLVGDKAEDLTTLVARG